MGLIGFLGVRGSIHTVILLLLVFSLGAQRTVFRAPPAEVEGSFLAHLSGTVVSEPSLQEIFKPFVEEKEYRLRFILKTDSILKQGEWVPIRMKVLVSVHEPGEWRLSYGDRVEIKGRLSGPRPPGNPSQFDFKKFCERRDISATLSVPSAGCVLRTGSGGNRLLRAVYGFKWRVKDRIEKVLARSMPGESGLLSALLLGEREQIERETYELFRRTGTVHLLAVSGLHTGLVGATVWLIFRLMPFSGPLRLVAPMIAVAFYAVLTGLGAPVVRASWLAFTYLAGQVLKKRQDLINTTGFSGFVILLFAPMQIYDAGFQLSYCAVLGILYLRKPLGELFGLLSRNVRELLGLGKPSLEALILADRRGFRARLKDWVFAYALELCLVSLTAWLGVMPLTAHYFGTSAPISILANIIAIPLVSLAVASGVVVVFAGSLVEVLSVPFLWMGAGALWALKKWMILLDYIPCGSFSLSAFSVAGLIGYCVCLGAVVFWERLRPSGVLCTVLLIANLSLWTNLSSSEREIRFTVLAVGHGTATVLELHNTTIVYDAGTYSTYDVGERVVVPYLLSRGRRRVDLLILSHSDLDHISGVPTLVERLKIRRVIYNTGFYLTEAGREMLSFFHRRGLEHRAVDSSVEIGGLQCRIEILSPPPLPHELVPNDTNETSLVVKFEVEGVRILLCADATDRAVRRLLTKPEALRAEIIVIPHHGGELLSCKELAEASAARYAVVSAGENFPSPRTLEAFESRAARLFKTYSDGAIIFSVNSGRIEVSTFR